MFVNLYSKEYRSPEINPTFSDQEGNSEIDKEAEKYSKLDNLGSLEYIKQIVESEELSKTYPFIYELYTKYEEERPKRG